MKVRIGIDVGGTFTDAVAINNDTYELIGTVKVPTTHTAKEGVAAGIVEVLHKVMEENGIPGISGVDTRRITRIIRDQGSQKIMITDPGTPLEEAVAAMKAYQLPRDVVSRVSCRKKWYSRTPGTASAWWQWTAASS